MYPINYELFLFQEKKKQLDAKSNNLLSTVQVMYV